MSVLADIPAIGAHAAAWLATVGPSRLLSPLSPGDSPSAPASAALAQSASQVVEAARLSPLQAGVLMASSLVVSAAIIAGGFWWWRVKNEPAGDAAFRIMARRMRLRPAERAAICRAAAARRVSPSGLLVSLDALRACLGEMPEPVRTVLANRCASR
jgi:hypothetical protein